MDTACTYSRKAVRKILPTEMGLDCLRNEHPSRPSIEKDCAVPCMFILSIGDLHGPASLTEQLMKFTRVVGKVSFPV